MPDLLTTVTSAFTAAFAAPGAGAAWLSVADDATPSYAMDAANWATPLSTNQFRSRAVWNSFLGSKDGPTLLAVSGSTATKWCVTAKHFGAFTSGTVRWITADGTVVSRTIVAGVQIDNTDIWMMQLNADIDVVSDGVAGAMLLPTDYTTKLAKPFYLPGLSVKADYSNAQLRAVTTDLYFHEFYYTQIPPALGSQFYEPPISGASGSPQFLAIGGQECVHGTNNGYSLSYYRAAIEAAAATLNGGAVSIATVDLSGYDTIPENPIMPTSTWTGAGANAAWETAGNWDNGVPGVTTDVTINLGSPQAVPAAPIDDVTVASLTVGNLAGTPLSLADLSLFVISGDLYVASQSVALSLAVSNTASHGDYFLGELVTLDLPGAGTTFDGDMVMSASSILKDVGIVSGAAITKLGATSVNSFYNVQFGIGSALSLDTGFAHAFDNVNLTISGTLNFVGQGAAVIRPSGTVDGTINAPGDLIVLGSSAAVTLTNATVNAGGALTLATTTGTGVVNVGGATLRGKTVSLFGTTGTPASVVQTGGSNRGGVSVSGF